jgi:hypothetical protein
MHAGRVHHNFKIDTSRFEQGKRASQTRAHRRDELRDVD